MPHLAHRPPHRSARRRRLAPGEPPAPPGRARLRRQPAGPVLAALAALLARSLLVTSLLVTSWLATPAMVLVPAAAAQEPPPTSLPEARPPADASARPAGSWPPAGPGAPAGTYAPPVDDPVVDPFRPPEHPWGPGNRGLEYRTAPGTPVRAAGAGQVTFAGPVAGSLHVTVLHPDGVRTSYSFLDRIDVRVGQRLDRGDGVGRSGEVLHLGARLGDAYFDPAALFGSGAARVRLVPFDDPLPGGRRGERSALHQLVGDVVGTARDLVTGTAESGIRTARLAGHLWWRAPINPLGLVTEVLEVIRDARHDADRPCTAPEVPPGSPPGRRVAILVAGLGSSSDRAAVGDVDVERLGYQPGDVVRFSYAGGRVPTGPAFVDVPERPYRAHHTHGDVQRAAGDLADLAEAAVAAAGGAPVDLVAHSMGGLVTRLALAELADRHGERWLDAVGLVATLGTPHQGAGLATMAELVGPTGPVASLLAAADDLTGLGARSPAVGQLSEVSALSRQLAGQPLPGSVQSLTVAASGDLVVAVPRTRMDGATPAVVVRLDGLRAHDDLPGSEEAHRELALALAGAPPTCRAFASALWDRVVGSTVSSVTTWPAGILTLAGTLTASRVVADRYPGPPPRPRGGGRG